MPAASAAGQDAYAAAEAEAEDRDWGTSRDDVEAYAAAAGTVAAAAACTAVGGAAVAGICGYLGGVLAEWIAGTVYSWFDNSDEVEAALERRRQVRANFAALGVAQELDRINQASFNQYLEDLIALHEQLWPGERWEGLDPSHPQARWQRAMLMLDVAGAPMVNNERNGVIVMGLASVAEEWRRLDQLGVYNAAKATETTALAQQYFLELERAYMSVVLQLTTQAAADSAQTDVSASLRGKAATVARFQQRFDLSLPPVPDARYRSSGINVSGFDGQDERIARSRTRYGAFVPPELRSWKPAGITLGVSLAAAAGIGWAVHRSGV